jgi:hypothetical protein
LAAGVSLKIPEMAKVQNAKNKTVTPNLNEKLPYF